MDITRRHFFARSSTGIGIAALGSLLAQDGFAAAETSATGGLPGLPHFAPKAKRVIFLHQSGGPSQMDLFDYKPTLDKLAGTELPGSVRMGQRITGMTSGQSAFPVARSIFKFEQHGQSGAWVSELLPHTAKIVDDIAIVKTMNTDAINHDPAITFIQTGSQQPGRPSMGAWVSYGLGSENRNLPAFVVMLSQAQALNPGPAALLAPVGQRLPALQAPGRALPRGQRSGALPAQSARASTRARAATCSTPPASSIACTSTSSAIPRSKRASRSTRWRSACRPRCRT